MNCARRSSSSMRRTASCSTTSPAPRSSRSSSTASCASLGPPRAPASYSMFWAVTWDVLSATSPHASSRTTSWTTSPRCYARAPASSARFTEVMTRRGSSCAFCRIGPQMRRSQESASPLSTSATFCGRRRPNAATAGCCCSRLIPSSCGASTAASRPGTMLPRSSMASVLTRRWARIPASCSGRDGQVHGRRSRALCARGDGGKESSTPGPKTAAPSQCPPSLPLCEERTGSRASFSRTATSPSTRPTLLSTKG